MKTVVKVALITSLLAAAVVHAAPGNGQGHSNPGQGNQGLGGSGQGSGSGQGASGVADVTLTNHSASAFELVQGQHINPVQSDAGFATQFATASGTAATAWTLAGTVEKDKSMSFSDKLSSDGLTFGLSKSTDVNGVWSVTNTSTMNTTLDLVLSFHAGDNVGSFLFNNLTVGAGQTLDGSWLIQWRNNPAQPASVPAFSNVAFYTGPLSQVAAVPEPATYAMLLGGLALIGYAGRRRKA